MYGIASQPCQFGEHVLVNTIDEMVYLIKESETLTGEKGRVFYYHHLVGDGKQKRKRVFYDPYTELLTVEDEESGYTECGPKHSASEWTVLGLAMSARRLFTKAL